MSSRDYRSSDRDRTRDRGGGRDEKDRYPRRRSSRSRSPRRGGERDRRDYPRDRDRDRESDRRGSRRPDDHRSERDHERPRDRGSRRDDDRERPRRGNERDEKDAAPSNARRDSPPRSDTKATSSRPQLDPDAPEEGQMPDADMEEPAAEDEEAMMAMMGMSGFGTTKGKKVQGNQEGGVDIKKVRTWRQYMNRRGGFNRPLDKIK